MSAKVRYLFPDQPALGHYVRIGGSNHVQLESLLEAGRLTIDRAVFDGALVSRQTGLIRAFREHGAELVLDTDVPELSSAKYFEGSLKQAPWAVQGRPLALRDFEGAGGLERISCIARFAVEQGFHTVLSPTHLVKSARDHGLRFDFETALKLRAALDAEGGQDVTLDFPLICAASVLRDDELVATLAGTIDSLPIEKIWIRSSGFGVTATPIGIVRYVRALRSFLDLSRPIISDGVAGLAGNAVLAFGAASGIAHGVGVHEGFDASDWHRRRKASGGGQPRRVLVGALDRQLTFEQIDRIVSTPSGRRLIVCNDTNCCPKGLDDMMQHPKAHYCFQRRLAVDDLAAVPYARRPGHFVGKMVSDAREHSRLLSRLKLADGEMRQVLANSYDRVERIYDLLDNFHSKNDFTEHSPAMSDRRPLRKGQSGARS